MRKKTWAEIEASRNRRLWFTQVGLPVAGGITWLYTQSEDFRGLVNKTVSKGKQLVKQSTNKIKDFFKDEEED